MPNDEFRLKHPTQSDAARAAQGDGAELPAPVRRRGTLSDMLDDTIRAIKRLPTYEQETFERQLAAVEERPVDDGRVILNKRAQERAIIERFQTVDRIDAPRLRDLAPHLIERREQAMVDRTRFDDVLDLIRDRPAWADVAFAISILGVSLAVLIFAISRFLR